MNIAHLLPTSAVFPLQKHNGRYEWALRLARLQAKNGHTVTVYAGTGSVDDSSILWESSAFVSENKLERNSALIDRAFSNPSHDIFHSHFDSLHFLLAHHTKKPIVATQHWYPTVKIAADARMAKSNNVYTVPVTNLMKEADRSLGIPSTDRIYHGIDLSLFSLSLVVSDRLLFVGRIHPGKGVKEAIEYATRADVGLDIVGKLNDSERHYWETIQGLIDGTQIRYLGQQSQQNLVKLYQSAKALIFPSQTKEAFGQVTIEAQACGTPVIISDVGASRELVLHHKTGFVCHTDAEFVEAIRSIELIQREACRAHATQFELGRMVNDYETLYHSLLTKK